MIRMLSRPRIRVKNGTAGATANEVGTSSTAADAGVTTLGSDRLALNFVAVNDDNAIAEFSGEAGGEWSLLGTYAESSGTDGAVGLQVGYTGHIHWPSTSSASTWASTRGTPRVS